MKEIKIYSERKEEAIDITKEVEKFVEESKAKDGVVTVYCPHTTAGIMINENADPDVKKDVMNALKKHFDDLDYDHSEGNSPAHVKASLLGTSQHVIVENGKLQLGTWQGIIFMEFDGPRERRVWMEIISS